MFNILSSFTLKTVLLFLFLASMIGCTKSNSQKVDFIKKNIEKTNKKNSTKHSELIVPDFLKDVEPDDFSDDK